MFHYLSYAYSYGKHKTSSKIAMDKASKMNGGQAKNNRTYPTGLTDYSVLRTYLKPISKAPVAVWVEGRVGSAI